MLTAAVPNDPVRFLRIRDVLKRVPISRPTIYRMMRRGDFPKAVPIGCSAVWVEKEIDEWVQARIDDR